jgi:hypothetical protein
MKRPMSLERDYINFPKTLIAYMARYQREAWNVTGTFFQNGTLYLHVHVQIILLSFDA